MFSLFVKFDYFQYHILRVNDGEYDEVIDEPIEDPRMAPTLAALHQFNNSLFETSFNDNRTDSKVAGFLNLNAARKELAEAFKVNESVKEICLLPGEL